MAEFPSTSDLLGAGTGLEARGLFSQEFSAIRQLPGAQLAESVSIGSGGMITPTTAFAVVASAGIVQRISTANTHAGMEIKLIAGPGLAVTVKHDPDSTGGIILSGEADFSLSDNRYITLKRSGDDQWIEIAPHVEGAGGSAEVDVATPSTLGISRPDGTTLTIADGVLTAIVGPDELATATATAKAHTDSVAGTIKQGEWLPIADAETQGITRFTTDSRLTAENTSEAVPASMHFSLYGRVSVAEGRITTASSNVDSLASSVSDLTFSHNRLVEDVHYMGNTRLSALEDEVGGIYATIGDISTALAAFLR